MTDHTDQMISIGGCRIRLMRGGSGPPLLFLHGGGGIGIWLPSMARLAKTFDVIAPEHPGFGAYVADAGSRALAGMAAHYETLFMHTLQTQMVLKWRRI